MDAYDVPKFSPVVDHRCFRWSVGKYLGKRRVTIAWFEDEFAAKDYAERARRYQPKFKFDYLQSML